MSLLVICEILGHFVKILPADEKYCLPSRENFRQRIPVQLSEKWIMFAEVFPPFLKSILVFKHF